MSGDHAHGHPHRPGHTHRHEHAHSPSAGTGRAFGWAIALNGAFVLVEAGFGFAAGSLALLADAAHNLTDVAGLAIAWGAAHLSRRPPTARHTYGLGRATILAALANAVAILLGVGAILWEAVHRLATPAEIAAGTVAWVALVGIGVNAGTAMLFMRGRHDDLNIRGAFLHMATDAAISAGVVVAALVVLRTGWQIVDPITAIVVGIAIGWSSYDLLRSAVHLSLDGVPGGIDVDAIERWLRAQPDVIDLHDLHVWSLSTTQAALSVHLVMPPGAPATGYLAHLADALDHAFRISHSTIQVERVDDPRCRLASAGVP